jgi:hypothetical protein
MESQNRFGNQLNSQPKIVGSEVVEHLLFDEVGTAADGHKSLASGDYLRIHLLQKARQVMSVTW